MPTLQFKEKNIIWNHHIKLYCTTHSDVRKS